MKLTYRILMAGAILFALASCSSKGEQAEVKEEAEQIENAHLDGREAARIFLGKEFKDSMQLQMGMTHVGVRRSKYDSLPQSRATFDSAFISTIRTVRPEIAAELEKNRR